MQKPGVIAALEMCVYVCWCVYVRGVCACACTIRARTHTRTHNTHTHTHTHIQLADKIMAAYAGATEEKIPRTDEV